MIKILLYCMFSIYSVDLLAYIDFEKSNSENLVSHLYNLSNEKKDFTLMHSEWVYDAWNYSVNSNYSDHVIQTSYDLSLFNQSNNYHILRKIIRKNFDYNISNIKFKTPSRVLNDNINSKLLRNEYFKKHILNYSKHVMEKTHGNTVLLLGNYTSIMYPFISEIANNNGTRIVKIPYSGSPNCISSDCISKEPYKNILTKESLFAFRDNLIYEGYDFLDSQQNVFIVSEDNSNLFGSFIKILVDWYLESDRLMPNVIWVALSPEVEDDIFLEDNIYTESITFNNFQFEIDKIHVYVREDHHSEFISLPHSMKLYPDLYSLEWSLENYRKISNFQSKQYKKMYRKYKNWYTYNVLGKYVS